MEEVEENDNDQIINQSNDLEGSTFQSLGVIILYHTQTNKQKH